jgi:hypothetical protein
MKNIFGYVIKRVSSGMFINAKFVDHEPFDPYNRPFFLRPLEDAKIWKTESEALKYFKDTYMEEGDYVIRPVGEIKEWVEDALMAVGVLRGE